MDSLTKDIRDFIISRTESVWQEVKENNEEYNKVQEKVLKAEEALVENLGEEEKELYNNCEELFNMQTTLLEQEMYKAGLKDGLKILGMVKGVEECMDILG